MSEAVLVNSPQGDTRLLRDRGAAIIAAGFLGTLALQVFLVFNKSINWDEFFHFSQVYELQQGRLTRDLQVFHARVFAWVPTSGYDIIGQIQTARLGMLGFELVSAAAIASMARQFVDRRAAWLTALAWLTGGYIFQHGFSFRADPMATAALMTALCLTARSRLDKLSVILASVLLGFAFIVTLKSVLYAPCFAGIAWLRLSRSEDRGAILRAFAAIAGLGALSFVAFYVFHRAGLPISDAPIGETSLNSGGMRFFSEGLFPQAAYVKSQLVWAPVLTIAVAIACALFWRNRSGLDGIALAGLLAPLAVCVVYRNAFPYYFVFAMAPAAVLAAPGIAWLRDRYGELAIVGVMTLTPLMLTVAEPRTVLKDQRALIEEVKRLFPEPTMYLAHTGIVADYPRALNMLASGVGMETYYRAGRPMIAQAIASDQLSFVIADRDTIGTALEGQPHMAGFLPEDVAALHANFVHYWGPLWLRGKRLLGTQSIEIGQPGRYTLGGAAITLDGKLLRPGETLSLKAGTHNSVVASGRVATLWRGESVPVAPADKFERRLFTRF